MKKMTVFFETLEEIGCKLLALIMLIFGISSLVAGIVGILDCLTGGESLTYGIAAVMIAVGTIFLVILNHMPKRFYDNLEY